MVKYSISWLALVLLIAGASMGLIASFQNLEAGRYDFIFLSLAFVMVVAAGIFLFNYASKEILRLDIAKQEKEDSEKIPERKREKKKTISESESLDIDPVARKIIRRISPGNSPAEWGHELLGMLSSELEIMSGIFYFGNPKNVFEAEASYAIGHAHEPYRFKEGEGLTGQAASNKAITVYKTIPDEYADVFSGLGKIKPSYLAIVPIIVNDKCVAVFECAGFKYTVSEIEHLLQIVAREIAVKISAEGEADKK
jgi:hypothetical protein